MLFLKRFFDFFNTKNKFSFISSIDGSVIKDIERIEDQFVSFGQYNFRSIPKKIALPKKINKNIFLQDFSNFIITKENIYNDEKFSFIFSEVKDLYKYKEYIYIDEFECDLRAHLVEKTHIVDYQQIFYSEISGYLCHLSQIAEVCENFVNYFNYKHKLRIIKNEVLIINKVLKGIFKSIPLKLIIYKYFDLIFTFKDKINNDFENLKIIINHLIVEHNAKKIFIRVNAFSQ